MRWLALAMSFIGAGAVDAAPRGWRPPTPSEADQPWRREASHRFLAISADFDGDGQPDQAELVVSTAETSGALVVTLARAREAPMVLDRLEGASWLEVVGIDVVTPGEYRTACGKGYWNCGPGEPERLKLDKPAIDLFQWEGANSFFVYDPSIRAFQRTWISD